MKKCPYCAEEIQDEAMKCRYCGEWLDKKLVPVEKESGENLEEDEIEAPEMSIKEEIEEEKKIVKQMKEDDDELSDEIFVIKEDEIKVKTFEKEKVGWGWGWFILFGLVGSGIQRIQPKLEYGLTIELLHIFNVLLLIFLPILYFKLRKRLILKKKYAQKWHASFMAGFISYFIAFLYIFVSYVGVQVIERKKDNAYLKQFLSAYTEKLSNINMEGAEIWESFINEPESVSDIEKNLTLMNQYLPLLDTKNTLSLDMMQGIESIVQKRRDIELNANYNRLKKISSIYFEKAKNGIQNLIEYHETSNEGNYNQFVEIMEDVVKIEEEMQRLYTYIASNL